MKKRIASALLLTTLCPVAATRADLSESAATQPQIAAAEKPRPWTFSFYADNDSRILKPNHDTDRFYTNGVAISFAQQSKLAERINDVIPFGDRYERFALGGTIGQLMFTPGNIKNPDYIPDDHPYAGYLYGGVFWQRADSTTMDHFQLDIGLVGPSSLAEDAQIWAHEITDADDPKGWDHQIRQEITGQGTFRKKWRLRADPDGVGLNADLIPAVGVSLGTVQTWAEGGATARIGINLPDDFGPGRVSEVGAATGDPARAARGFGFYGFVRVAGRAVGHNMLIEGNNFRDSNGESIYNLVGEIQGGVAVQYHWDNISIDLMYGQTVVTPEFREQETTHAYGSLSLAVTVEF